MTLLEKVLAGALALAIVAVACVGFALTTVTAEITFSLNKPQLPKVCPAPQAAYVVPASIFSFQTKQGRAKDVPLPYVEAKR